MSKLVAVFDLDDTICKAKNRQYKKALPIKEVIDKANYMHDVLQYEIVIYTSRGMVSCNGDVEKAKEKNEEQIKAWLSQNGVKYDRLIFGKPIADVYIDDKAISLKDFVEGKDNFVNLNGGSGKLVTRIGNTVKKEFGSEEEKVAFQEWNEINNGFLNAPKIYSYLYNSVYMEYVDGVCAKDIIIDKEFVVDFYSKVSSTKNIKEFSIRPQIDILIKNKSEDEEMNGMIDWCTTMLLENESVFAKHSSFSHGDATLSNMIVYDNKVTFIDPRYIRGSSSYLFDLAKFRMSLCRYEFNFGLSNVIQSFDVLRFFDDLLKQDGIYKQVLVLNLMYVLRLYRYKPESKKEIVKMMARELEVAINER